MARAAFIFAFVFAGCASRPIRFQSPAFFAKAPSKVIVLPFDNESVDLVAPGQLQQLVAAGLRKHGYAPLNVDDVTTKLREMGITDGGQLPAVDPQTLGQAFDVDGLFYGTVEEFLFQDLGFLLRRIVKLRLRLVSASTGERLWEDFSEGSTVLAAGNPKDAKKLFAAAMAQKSIENMTHRPLWKESNQAVDRILMKLPPPGAGANRYLPSQSLPPGQPAHSVPSGPPPMGAPVPPPGSAPPTSSPGMPPDAPPPGPTRP